MRRLALVTTVVAAALGCKSSKPTAAPPTPPAATDGGVALDAALAVDAEAAAIDDPGGPDEAALRVGKRAGLGAPDERPEVAVEAFAQGLLDGTIAWSRVVDPGRGVVELRTLDGDSHVVPAVMGRRCGKDADATLAMLSKATATALGNAALGYRLACDNSALTASPPSAVCSIDADDDQNGFGFDLVFVADPARGLRLAGVTLLDATPPPPAVADGFDAELGAATGCN